MMKADKTLELLQQRRTDELWQYYLGYLDLDMDGRCSDGK
jgi:hypothetical protein